MSLPRLSFFRLLSTLLLFSLQTSAFAMAVAKNPAVQARPNILWIISEDNSPFLGCYGDSLARTPHLDALAAEGLRYTNAYANAPVCAPARFTLLTGVHASSAGTLHMRSYFPKPIWMLPPPGLLKQAGYYTTNNAKTDYNYDGQHQPDFWNESGKHASYRNRAPGQPFYHVQTLMTTHEGRLHQRSNSGRTPQTDPAAIRLPPYHPDTPEIRLEWAHYYDLISEMDAEVGALLEQLKADGLAESTVVFYFADHGGVLAGSKRYVNEAGTRVPLIIRVPEAYADFFEARAPSVVSDLVSFVDFAPTVLDLGGVEIPDYFEGVSFAAPLAPEVRPPVFMFRGRMDERYDCTRSFRKGAYRYTRHYQSELPEGRYLNYLWRGKTAPIWKSYAESHGDITSVASFWRAKPFEALYNVETDPFQVDNLASAPEYRDVVEAFRALNQEHLMRYPDLGLIPEGELFQRTQGQAPYDWIRQSGFDYPAVVQAADLSSRATVAELDQLIGLLAAPESVVRFWAAQGIGRLAVPDSEAIQMLEAGLADQTNDTRVAYAQALVRLGAVESGAPVLIECLQHPLPEVALRAADALTFCAPMIGDYAGKIVPESATTYPWNKYMQHALARLIDVMNGGTQ